MVKVVVEHRTLLRQEAPVLEARLQVLRQQTPEEALVEAQLLKILTR
jgi:hypothetical protein